MSNNVSNINKKNNDEDYKNKRSEQRVLVNREYQFEFIINSTRYSQHCILWNIASKGFGILIKKNSPLMRFFKIGLLMKMRYFEAKTGKPSPYFKVEIRHISQNKNENNKNFLQIGVLILHSKT